MPLPDEPRVIYGKAVLEEVICQLRFPPILKIATQTPAEFQDAVRVRFPLLEERLADVRGLPRDLASMLPGFTSAKAFDFRSAQGDWSVSLSRDFLALSTGSYVRWEGFREYLDQPLAAFQKLYTPAFYQRIGLRYRDVVIRSKLGLEDRSWSDLLRPHISGELDVRSSMSTEILAATREVRMDLGGGAQVTLRHFLASVNETGEQCYVIDADYYTDQRTETTNAVAVLNRLNSFAGKLFRWCITDTLHRALEPQHVART